MSFIRTKLIDPSMGMNSQSYHFMKMAEMELPRIIGWTIPDDFTVQTLRYHNGREQGFLWTISKWSPNLREKTPQINFVWYEHRNSDKLCCIKWTGDVKTPIDKSVTYSAIPEEVFPDKWSYTKGFRPFRFREALAWWANELQDWYDEIKEREE